MSDQIPRARTPLAAGGAVDLFVSTGMTESAARTALDGAGLEVGGVTPKPSCEVAGGVVLTSDPGGGTQVERGSAVGLTVSSGEPAATVPDVIGRPEAEAVATLQGAGFATTVGWQTDEEVPEGAVFSTDPWAGTVASTCRPVAVTVSTGPAPVTVPEVAGSTEADARAAIEGSGLTVDPVTRESSCEAPNGVVISSNPGGGTQVERGSAVGLVVSAGEPQAVVPDVAGRPESEAVELLQDAGFAVGTVNQEASETVAEGSAIRSDPGAGTNASTCTAVTLTVSTGPSTVTVPDVVGESEGTATEILQEAGLEPGQVTKQQVDSSQESEQVLDQDPDGGTQTRRGSTVSLTVSCHADESDCPEPPFVEGPG